MDLSDLSLSLPPPSFSPGVFTKQQLAQLKAQRLKEKKLKEKKKYLKSIRSKPRKPVVLPWSFGSPSFALLPDSHECSYAQS